MHTITPTSCSRRVKSGGLLKASGSAHLTFVANPTSLSVRFEKRNAPGWWVSYRFWRIIPMIIMLAGDYEPFNGCISTGCNTVRYARGPSIRTVTDALAASVSIFEISTPIRTVDASQPTLLPPVS